MVKRSKDQGAGLPGRNSIHLPSTCFISHSYRDEAVREQLLRQLHSSTTPVVFPPIKVKPREFVSNHLIEAILDCDGLIYLQGGHSERSFWVTFERDYALRSGKQVFAYDPVTHEITRDTSPPLTPEVFTSFAGKDKALVMEKIHFLSQERHFDLWVVDRSIEMGVVFKQEFMQAHIQALVRTLSMGGYVVVFWSKAASRSSSVIEELEILEHATTDTNDHVLFALLENHPLPKFWSQYNDATIQLYGDSKLSATHRLDDLVVRLYWLIYRKTRNV